MAKEKDTEAKQADPKQAGGGSPESPESKAAQANWPGGKDPMAAPEGESPQRNPESAPGGDQTGGPADESAGDAPPSKGKTRGSDSDR